MGAPAFWYGMFLVGGFMVSGVVVLLLGLVFMPIDISRDINPLGYIIPPLVSSSLCVYLSYRWGGEEAILSSIFGSMIAIAIYVNVLKKNARK